MITADAIVVGLGAMGSATAWQLARRGLRVIGIDRFTPPHERGASHGETRITRHATGEGEAYVSLAMRSHAIWREIEAATGDDLLLVCGGLVLAGSGASHPKKAAFLDTTIAAARRFGIPHELLGPSEVRTRFPQFQLEGDEAGYFEPGAGLVYPERCVAAQLGLAARAGAAIRNDERVRRIAPRDGAVRVTTDRDTYEAGTVFVTAGGWNPELVPGAPIRAVLHRQVLTWFETLNPADFEPGRFPIFIWISGSTGETSYGFPTVPGSRGVKVATESYEPGPETPDGIDREVGAAEIADLYKRHVAGRFAGVGPLCLQARACFYTQVPDSRFIIERHPDSERIVLVSACSGHGFKHSAAIGEALAAELVGDGSRPALAAFAPA